MSYKYSLIIGCSLVYFFSSCNKKELSYKEYVAYIENADNGLVRLDSIDGVTYKISYKPTNVMVYQSLQNEEFNSDAIDSLKSVYSEYEYFLLSISSKNTDVLSLTSRQDFSRIMQDVSFHMQDMVYMVRDDNDTLYLEDFIAPRFYGLSNATSILLAFKKKGIEPKYFKVHVKGLFGGSVDLKFKNKDLTELPTLKFS